MKRRFFVGLENALLAACKGIYSKNDNINVTVNRSTGDLKIIANKEVIDENDEKLNFDTLFYITLADARKINPNVSVIGDVVQVELDYRSLDVLQQLMLRVLCFK